MIKKRIYSLFFVFISMIEEFYKRLEQVKQNYISLKDIEEFQKQYLKLYQTSKNKEFQKIYQSLDHIRKECNIQFLKQEEKIVSQLLDDVKGYPLDQEQRQVVLQDEQNTLVIAGAGSGKSLTMIGKIRYLIERKKIPIDQILCISFTNDATNSLKSTLKKYYNYNLSVVTFHKLALEIIRKTGGKVNIAEDNLLDKVVEKYLKSTIFQEKDGQKWICQHFFHNNKNKTNLSVNKMQSFPHIYNVIQKTNYFQKLKKVISTFIHLMKSNQKTDQNISHWIQRSKFFNTIPRSDTYLLFLIERIYQIYQNTLKQNNCVDFDDMINQATLIVKQGCSFHYQYILIDEYQDTSTTRYELIQAIIQKTNAKLIVVGDDFQSIYRFTGCDLNIFLKFKQFFPYANILKIQNTYRNSQELIHVAGNFVMRNPRQMTKNLKSNKHIMKPIIIQYYQNILMGLKKILDTIPYQDIFLLGRNHCDLSILKNDFDFIYETERNICYKKRPELHLTFLTVHCSKGLESEAVIILNMKNTIMGFPSQLEDDPIIRYVNQTKDYYPYEEERRLFYVAITRTKNEAYLLVPKNPSIFIQELIRKDKKYIHIQKDRDMV